MKSPFIPPRRISQSVTDSWRYLTTRLLRSAGVTIIFVVTFCVGFVSAGLAKQSIPKTVFTSPIPTLTLMKNFPVGASVLPTNTPAAKELFEQFGWWQDPAVIVGYETITYKQEMITLCQIRTHRGKGRLLTVNPVWFEVPQAP
jgi:hypothetical protein